MKILAKVILVLVLASSLCAQQPGKGTADQPAKKDTAENQDAKPVESFYKLNFVLYELEDGKRTNQRDYSMIGRTNSGPARISVMTRVPIYSEEKKMTYIDAGLSLNCTLRDQTGGKLQAQCDTDISGFVRAEQLPESRANGVPAPVLRSTRTNSWIVLTPGKAAILASVDDVNSAKRTQIEITATKLD
jgi:hypothetical protein